MTPEQTQTAIAEMSFERAFQDGYQRGFQQGYKQGFEKGLTDTFRRIALVLAAKKLGERFDAALEERIRAADAQKLDALVTSMIATDDPAEILAILARLS